MNVVYLLIGANIGEPEKQLKNAKSEINNRIGQINTASSVYKSEAWGVEDQPVFLNQALEVHSQHSATEILDRIHQIEADLGRVRFKRWEARVIDIDILYFNHDIIQLENLTIPHPYIQKRNFVLIPMNEIAQNFKHPILNKTTSELLNESTDPLTVKPLKMYQYKVINPEAIKSNMMNNMEMIKQLISLYLTQGKEDFQQLENAFNNRDLAEIASKAHHIKPTMEYIGASPLRIQFTELEKLAKEHQSIAKIQESFKTIKANFETALEELSIYSASLA